MYLQFAFVVCPVCLLQQKPQNPQNPLEFHDVNRENVAPQDPTENTRGVEHRHPATMVPRLPLELLIMIAKRGDTTFGPQSIRGMRIISKEAADMLLPLIVKDRVLDIYLDDEGMRELDILVDQARTTHQERKSWSSTCSPRTHCAPQGDQTTIMAFERSVG